MADDEDQRRDQRQPTLPNVSNDKSAGRSRWRKRGGQSSHDQAVEIVDRLEHALRNLFK